MPKPTFELIELFSGQGNVSKAFRQCGRQVCSFDKILADDPMDFGGLAGFAFGPHQMFVPGFWFPIVWPRLAVWVTMCAGLLHVKM